MTSFLQLLKSLRPINLVIVAITQFVIYHHVILKFVEDKNLGILSNPWMLSLFISVTIIIAAGGYLINDAFDLNTDLINQKSKGLSKRFLLTAYYISFFLGLIIAFYISVQIEKIHLVSIYIFSFALLYLYSSHLKNLGLIANVVVAAFSSFVIGILWFAEIEMISILENRNHEMLNFILKNFVFFAFVISLIRELVKDLEDMEGDKAANIKTTAVRWKKKNIDYLMVVLFLLLAVQLVSSFTNGTLFNFSWILLFLLLVVIGLVLLTARLYHRAKIKSDFTRLSKLLKITMLMGLIYLMRLTNELWIF